MPWHGGRNPSGTVHLHGLESGACGMRILVSLPPAQGHYNGWWEGNPAVGWVCIDSHDGAPGPESGSVCTLPESVTVPQGW